MMNSTFGGTFGAAGSAAAATAKEMHRHKASERRDRAMRSI
jgi:hypothetical protein